MCKEHRSKYIQVRCDSSCSVAYLNATSGVKSKNCNSLAKQIRFWFWYIERDLWLSATHVPGSENEADESSRHINKNIEWMLDKSIFRQF